MRYLLRKQLLVVLPLLCASTVAGAESRSVGDSAHHYRTHGTLNAQIGTTGLRFYYNRVSNYSARLMLRAGAQYIRYQKPIPIKLDKEAVITMKPDFMIGMVEVSARWQVFRQRSLYIASGLAYNWNPTLGLRINAKDKLVFDDLELTPTNVGVINLSFRWHKFMPYVGFGLGRPSPKRRFSVGFEMGAFYMGRPRVHLDYTGFLETTTITEQVPTFERNLSRYRYLPTINLSLTYRLNSHFKKH